MIRENTVYCLALCIYRCWWKYGILSCSLHLQVLMKIRYIVLLSASTGVDENTVYCLALCIYRCWWKYGILSCSLHLQVLMKIRYIVLLSASTGVDGVGVIMSSASQNPTSSAYNVTVPVSSQSRVRPRSFRICYDVLTTIPHYQYYYAIIHTHILMHACTRTHAHKHTHA